MRFSKMKAVIISGVVVLLCIAALVVASFALFSDQKGSQDNHLQAGTLEVGLRRTKFVGFEKQSDGTFKKVENTESVDLTEDQNPVFSIESAIPGVYQEATLLVENKGSIPFNYEFSITNVEQGTADAAASAALCEQLQIIVTDATGAAICEPFLLSEASEVGAIDLGMLAAEASASFTVRVEFLVGDEADLSAMGGDVTFDLTVYAEQQTVE